MLDAHVVKARRKFTVDAAVRVGDGECCALFGASGAGKSTILACIAGVETPDAGHVEVGGRSFYPPPAPLHVRGVGYMTQDPDLFPHLSVAQNVRFGIANGATGAAGAANAWIGELRERLGLGPLWDAPAYAISGGQARRVAMARMIARKPRLVLLDEPFAGLDRHLVRELLPAIVEWQETLRFTLLVVDHDVEVLERLAPRAIVLEDGRVVQDAPWAALRRAPATPLLASLLAPL
jgi:molybdate transport system ATP-binding protein